MKIFFPLAAALLSTTLPLAATPKAGETLVGETRAPDGTGFRVVRIASGLAHPWSIDWLPDGRLLVTERPGHLSIIAGDQITRLEGLPRIHGEVDQKTAPDGGQQGGLFDVAVHPDHKKNGWIYFSFSSPGDPDAVAGDDKLGTATTLMRARLNAEGTALVDRETIYAQAPATDPGRHYGGRILLPGDGSVFLTIGDRGLRRPAQDLTDPAGSIVRLQEDGGPHPGNPFVNAKPGNLRPEIYSFGHRNNQGLARDPSSGTIWTTEHGPNGGDMLHLVAKGNNYGWPQVSYGLEYQTGAVIGIGRTAPGITAPEFVWQPALAPSGLAWYSAEAFPAWRGSLFAGFLVGQQLSRLVVENNRITREEVLLKDQVGRIRDVRQGPDGNLYVVTDHGDGAIYRIEPAENPRNFMPSPSQGLASGYRPTP